MGQSQSYRRYRSRIVPRFASPLLALPLLAEQFRFHHFDAHGADGVAIVFHRRRFFRRVPFAHGGRDARSVHDGAIDQPGAAVSQQRGQMVRGTEVGGLAGLRHQIHEAGFEGLRLANRLRNACNQEVGDQAGEQRARPDGDQIGLRDRLQRLRQGLRAAGFEAERMNPLLAAPDAGFPAHHGAIFQHGGQRHVGCGGRINASCDLQHFGRLANRVGKVAGNVGERRQEEVAEAVAFESTPGIEAVLEQAGEEGAILGESHHAVADIAGRKYVEFATETTGTATVVSDGDDGGDVEPGVAFFRRTRVTLQSGEERGKAIAAADGDNAKSFRHFMHQSRPCRTATIRERWSALTWHPSLEAIRVLRCEDRPQGGQLLGQRDELGILSRQNFVLRLKRNGTSEILAGSRCVTREAAAEGEGEKDVLGVRLQGESLIQMFPGHLDVPRIQTLHAVVEMVVRRSEMDVAGAQLPRTNLSVRASLVGNVHGRATGGFRKPRLCQAEFTLSEELHGLLPLFHLELQGGAPPDDRSFQRGRSLDFSCRFHGRLRRGGQCARG